MNPSDYSFDREEAVRKSAELLRDFRAAFFPLDVFKMLSAFGRQISLCTYDGLESLPAAKAAISGVNPQMISRDGFCCLLPDTLFRFGKNFVEGPAWFLYYNDSIRESRIRFTLMHELGHIVLGHHRKMDTNILFGLDKLPEYRALDHQADLFSINMLAPAPAVYRFLKEHGFSWVPRQFEWKLTNPDKPYLRNFRGSVPNPEVLVMTAFGLSQAAANQRLRELSDEMIIWESLDRELYSFLETIPYRSGWFCDICHTRRRTTSFYCPACGRAPRYEYRDFGAFSRPVIGLRENGSFAFCSVCGNADLPEDAAYCPVCGNPVINECENAQHTDGDFIRSGMDIIRGTHRCKPTDVFCGTCGVLTAFGRNHGPQFRMWLSSWGGERCRIREAHYPEIFPSGEGRLQRCPSCGSTRTLWGGLSCADCLQSLQNRCVSDGGEKHVCGVNDRYCRICGNPTLFFQAGMLPEYTETETFAELRKAEKYSVRKRAARLIIQPDGEICCLNL